MEIQIVTQEEFNRFKQELLAAIEVLLKESRGSPDDQWLKSKDVRNILHCSPGTLQSLRIRGVLPYTKIGGTIYYKGQDVYRVLNAKTC